jgi:hypothetical protein
MARRTSKAAAGKQSNPRRQLAGYPAANVAGWQGGLTILLHDVRFVTSLVFQGLG